jgi:DNA-binding beta-propeller fold protein YncE
MISRIIVLMIVVAAVSMLEASSHTGTVLVANKGEQTLGIIDPTANRQIATVRETGITGHEVVASPDGKLAFVPIYGNSGVGLPGTDGRTIDVVDLKQRRIVHTIDFNHGVRPHCAVFGPQDGLLYVTTELDNSVAVIDPHTFTILGKIPTAQAESHMLAITPDGRFGYTANVGPGTVSVLDMTGRKTVTIIRVAGHVQRISISPDGRRVFTSDTERPRLAVIDATTNRFDRWIELPGEGYGTAATSDGKWLLVAMPGADAVAVIDLASLQVKRTVPVPPAPQEVLIQPDGREAYVSCDRSHQVAAISTADWSTKLIDAGKTADGLAWAR